MKHFFFNQLVAMANLCPKVRIFMHPSHMGIPKPWAFIMEKWKKIDFQTH
jgi:hypothetical protein